MMFWFSECRAMITITQFIESHWMSFSVCCPLLPNSEALGEKKRSMHFFRNHSQFVNLS